MTVSNSTDVASRTATGARARPARESRWGMTIVYGLSLLVAVGVFLLVRHYGEGLAAASADVAKSAAAPVAAKTNVLLQVLIALVAVIVTGRVLAKLFVYLGQPPVIGDVVAGIVLGPSLLGPEVSALILPPSVAPFLGIIAQLGVLLYMFIVGLDLNADLIRRQARVTVATSHASILAPFLLGTVVALYLYPRLATANVPFTSFALFMGVAMSITAFPVLARILTDRRMARTQLGVVALSCAAADDVTAWCLLALVVGVTRSDVGGALMVMVCALAYIVLMFVAVRPIMGRIVARWERPPGNAVAANGIREPGGPLALIPSPVDAGEGGEPLRAARALEVIPEQLPRGAVTFVFVAVLVSALTTEAIGIHAIFGAFLLGVMIPHDSAVARAFTRKLEPVVTTLLLPAFFAFTGMRTQIGLVTGLDQWLMCALIIFVATLGKFGGAFVAARLTGMDWRNAAALGTLMNTRGLMELIVLNIGLDLGVISPLLFTMMVLMALVTTMATAPVLRWLLPRGAGRAEGA